MKFFVPLEVITLISSTALALSPAGWRSQSIYQVVTDRFARTDGSTTAACNTADQVYCGGTWNGLIKHLDYIQGMGFTAIWISPVVAQLVGSSADGEAYHGYWAQDINSLNSNFGTASDLENLSAALHARNMYLMVDVVTNHFAYLGCSSCVQYDMFTPFSSSSYFHPPCTITYSNMTSVQVCWEGDSIVSLPDLRTEDVDVLSVFQTWIANLVSTYSIDGLRIDSAQQVDPAFFPPFQSSAGVHILGEIMNGNPPYVCPFQNYMSGLLNYPAYYWITQAFQSTTGSISNLVNGIASMKSNCGDTTLLGSFSENHDQPRFPSYTTDMSQAKNVIAFTILSDGIPIVYQGQEQHLSGSTLPADREAIWLTGYPTASPLYAWIRSLNQIRSQAIYRDGAYVTSKASVVYSDSTTIVTRKGDTGYQIIGVFSNKGASGSSYTLSLSSAATGFTASQSLVEVMGCTAYTSDASGTLSVAMASGLPRIFYPLVRLIGSGICSAITGPKTSTKIAAATSSLTTATATSPTSACSTATPVPITFSVMETTAYGQTIKLSGNVTALGTWSTASAISLSAANYTASNPQWFVTVNLPAGAGVAYKFVNVASDGSVAWEGGSNRVLGVPGGCAATATTVSGTWQS